MQCDGRLRGLRSGKRQPAPAVRVCRVELGRLAERGKRLSDLQLPDEVLPMSDEQGGVIRPGGNQLDIKRVRASGISRLSHYFRKHARYRRIGRVSLVQLLQQWHGLGLVLRG